MNELNRKMKQAMENGELLERKDFPKKIGFDDYYCILKDSMMISKEKGNSIQEQYCAMHILALAESMNGNQILLNKENFKIEKDIYNEVLYIIEKRNQKFKQFVIKNACISLALAVVAFILIAVVMRYDIILATVVAMIVLVVDLFANGKTNDKRYQEKMLRMFNKKVNPNLLLLNEIYFQKQIK